MILTRLYYSTQFSNIARVMNRLTLYISYQEYVLYSRHRLPSASWRYKQSCSRIFCLLSSISSEITETKTTKTFDTSGRPSSHPKPCSTSVRPHTHMSKFSHSSSLLCPPASPQGPSSSHTHSLSKYGTRYASTANGADASNAQEWVPRRGSGSLGRNSEGGMCSVGSLQGGRETWEWETGEVVRVCGKGRE
jgi:hypothetical protein